MSLSLRAIQPEMSPCFRLTSLFSTRKSPCAASLLLTVFSVTLRYPARSLIVTVPLLQFAHIALKTCRGAPAGIVNARFAEAFALFLSWGIKKFRFYLNFFTRSRRAAHLPKVIHCLFAIFIIRIHLQNKQQPFPTAVCLF